MKSRILLSQSYKGLDGRLGRDFYAGEHVGFGRIENISDESRGWPLASKGKARRTALVSFADKPEFNSEPVDYDEFTPSEA